LGGRALAVLLMLRVAITLASSANDQTLRSKTFRRNLQSSAPLNHPCEICGKKR